MNAALTVAAPADPGNPEMRLAQVAPEGSGFALRKVQALGA